MRKALNGASVAGTQLAAIAAITPVVLLLVFAAFDDITTASATTFRVEYTLLVGCAGWLLFVGGSLIRGGHRTFGCVSLVALASALWAQQAIGPGMDPGRLRPEYVVIAHGPCPATMSTISTLLPEIAARVTTPARPVV